MNFLICFYDKPDSDECGRRLERRWFCPRDSDFKVTPLESWDEVSDAAAAHVNRHYGGYLEYPSGELECWVWEAGRVSEARQVSVNIEQTISVTAKLQ